MTSKRRVTLCLLYGLLISVLGETYVNAQESINLLALYPSDQTAFTQGFEVHPELEPQQLLLGTGLYGESSIGILDLETGEYQIIETLDKQYFAEGLTLTENAIWQLTWKEGTAFKRALNSFEVLETANYTGQGWGLAYDEKRQVLWMSDGTSQLSLRDPDSFDLLDTLEVTYKQQSIGNLNELEFANDMIYANIWLTDQIVAINPENGQIEQIYDLKALIEQVNQKFSAEEVANMDVLNGIAHKENNVFYLTGKQYPYVLEVELPR